MKIQLRIGDKKVHQIDKKFCKQTTSVKALFLSFVFFSLPSPSSTRTLAYVCVTSHSLPAVCCVE